MLNKRVGWFTFKAAFELNVVLINAIAFIYIWVTGRQDVNQLLIIKSNEPNLLYFMEPFYNQTNQFMLYLIIFAQAVVTALLMFVFTINKRASIAYFNLPISREQLFFARYMAGLILTFIPHILFFTYMFFVNAVTFGFSQVLFQGYAIMLATILTTLFFIYSVSTAICMCVGTICEKLMFSWVIMYGINSSLVSVTLILMLFLHGNAMGETYADRMLSDNIVKTCQRYIPPNGSLDIFGRYSKAVGHIEDFRIPFWGDQFSAGWGTLLIWVILAVMISWLALVAFKHFKTEHAGVQGINQKMNNAAVFLFTFAMFNRDGPGNDYRTKLHMIFMMFLWSLGVFILSRLILTKSVKKIFNAQGLKIYGSVWVVVLIIALCGLTGGFGYSRYQPAVSDISYSEITYTGAPDFIAGQGNYYGNFLRGASTAQRETNICVRDYTDLSFNSENDLSIVLTLHKKMIDAGSFPVTADKSKQFVDDMNKDWLWLWVNVRYTLKNGKTADRLYKALPAKVARDLLQLDETDAVKKRVSDATALAVAKTDQGGLPLYVYDNLFTNGVEIKPDHIKTFLTALQKDIDDLPLDEKYFPDQPAGYVVSFPRLVEDGGVIGLPVYSIESDPLRALNIAVLTDVNEDVFFNANPFQQYTSTIQFYITSGYVNTLAFLREHGYSGSINTDTSVIQSIYAKRYRIKPDYISQSLYFRSVMTTESIKYGESVAIPSDKYADILRLARSNYYVSNGGYQLWVDVAGFNGDTIRTTLFVPEADAPEFLRKLVSSTQ